MLFSMTGFSRIRKVYPWGTLSVELSSVNSRYLEINARSDRELSGFEPFIQNTLRGRLQRGKVTVRTEVRWDASVMKDRLNAPLLRAYYEQLSLLQRELGGSVPSVESLLALPGIVEASPLEGASDGLQSAVAEVLDEAVSALLKMRASEGEALASDITSNLDSYEKLVDGISEAWQGVSQKAFADYREKVTRNIAQLGYEADPARLAQELVVLADKWDISEELTRSRSHISQFRKILTGGGAVGRKLDFLLQEMNREMNTMGSKSASTELRWRVVDGKSLLERIREQIQNVE